MNKQITPNELRKKILIMSEKAGACHIGSSLSCVELALVMSQMKGQLIFSKASGVATIYAILDKDWKHLKDNPLCWPGGSLGHGLPIACGVALGDRNSKTFCLMSDAELNEGTTWESLLFASHNKLKNLVIVIDYNKLQSCGSCESILALEPLADKFKSFGFNVVEIDGHNVEEITKELSIPLEYCLLPTVIIAHTTKGKGVDFMENDYEWHYKNLTPKLLEDALKQL